MADEADMAQAITERHIKHALTQRKPVAAATGFCFNCDEEIEFPKKFCNKDCRDDYEKLERRGLR